MAYPIEVKPSAADALARISKAQRTRIAKRIDRLVGSASRAA